jgi:transcriptional regulator GlxA family with amidase domain
MLIPRKKRIVITGPSPVQLLNIAGPLEVFARVPTYEVVLGSSDGSGILKTSPDFALTGAVPLNELRGEIDTLLIVGGPGAEQGNYDQSYLTWIKEAAGRARRVASICSGTFVLAATGLLDGKQVATHWNHCERLAREFPSIIVNPDPIYLRDGSIYTSAGVTSSIDLSLALVEEDHGHKTALEVARHLVMFLVRPGRQAQHSHMLSHQATISSPLHELHVWMLEHLRDDLSVKRLAERMGMSLRHFNRVFVREIEMNPGAFVDRMRVEAAQQMISSSSMVLKEIADKCGFRSANAMFRCFNRILGISAGEYANRVRGTSFTGHTSRLAEREFERKPFVRTGRTGEGNSTPARDK